MLGTNLVTPQQTVTTLTINKTFSYGKGTSVPNFMFR